MAKHLLSKSTFIRGQQCQKSLYLHNKRPFLRDKLSAAQLAKFKRGTDVGVLARSLFPGGIDMTPRSPSLYQQQRQATLEALQNTAVKTIYEAVFQYDDTLIMLDILQRDETGWKAYEVKSSRSISTTYLADAALQYYVLNGNNLIINDFYLIHVNPDYILADELVLDDLFSFYPVLAEVQKQLPAIAAAIATSKQTLQLSNSPDIKVGAHCHLPYPCDFIGHCWKNTPLKIRSLRTISQQDAFKQWNNLPGTNKLVFDAATKSQQLELKAFEEESLQYCKEGLKIFKQRLKSSSRNASMFLLSHQPAVPIIKGSGPYQVLPLAICLFDPAQHSFTEIVFQQDIAGMKHFMECMEQFFQTYQILQTHDAGELKKAMDSSVLLSGNSSFECQKTEIEGIIQLIEEVPFFHPGFGSEWKLDELYSCFTGKKTQLKDNAWLINDLMQAGSEAEKNQELNRYRPFALAIHEIFEAMNTLDSIEH